MLITKEAVEDFYKSDTFLKLHKKIEIDSPWKAQKLRPLLHGVASAISKDELRVLDVGGGSGIVMKLASDYLEQTCKKTVHGMALDLSPGFLDLQKKNNPSLKETFNRSLAQTLLEDKSIDLVLLIDVIEHLYDLKKCYDELRRIAKFVIIKIPLEKNLTVYMLNLLNGYRKKRAGENGIGHINFYSFVSIQKELNANLGTVISCSLTDVFSYLLGKQERRNELSPARLAYCTLGREFYRLSPWVTSLVFNDFAIALVQCS